MITWFLISCLAGVSYHLGRIRGEEKARVQHGNRLKAMIADLDRKKSSTCRLTAEYRKQEGSVAWN